MCIYILIRAFKNNTIYSALPPPLLLVLFFAGCVLYLKHAQQLKVFFTQIEFAPRTNLPSLSRPRPRPAAQALSLLLLPSQLTSPSSSLLLALPILLPVIGRCHWRHGKFAAIATSLTKYSIKNALKRKLKSEKATKKKNTRSEAKTSYTSSRAVAKCVVWERGEGVRHNLIESVISINFKSLLMRIDKNTRRASFAAT